MVREAVFLMTWAYKDKPEMTAQLAEEYTLAGNNNNVLVIPAGLSFAKADRQAIRPGVLSTGQETSDPVGTYLAACTTYCGDIQEVNRSETPLPRHRC